MGPTEVKGTTEVNFKQGEIKKILVRSTRELIPCTLTFKMMAPLLNVVHLVLLQIQLAMFS